MGNTQRLNCVTCGLRPPHHCSYNWTSPGVYRQCRECLGKKWAEFRGESVSLGEMLHRVRPSGEVGLFGQYAK